MAVLGEFRKDKIMGYDPGTEADNIGWDYDDADIQKEDRERNGNFTEFELMLAYHDMDESEWMHESNNSQSQLWWNYRKFGKGA